MRSGLFTEIKNNPWALGLVIAIHIVIIVLLSINLANDQKPDMPAAKKHNIVNAVVVDAKKFDDREKDKKLIEKKKVTDKKALEEKRLKKNVWLARRKNLKKNS